MCIHSALFWKHRPPFSRRAFFDFCLAIQRWHWFRFYSCESADKYSLCSTSRLAETFPHMPSSAILLLTPTPDRPFVFGTRIGNPSHHSKIFSFSPCTLNCELQCGCKVVSSTRLLLFTLSRLPSPRLLSASPQFKATLKKREAASQAFYDFIGPEEALLGRCCASICVLSLIMSLQTAAVCLMVDVCIYIMCLVSELFPCCGDEPFLLLSNVRLFLFTQEQTVFLLRVITEAPFSICRVKWTKHRPNSLHLR